MMENLDTSIYQDYDFSEIQQVAGRLLQKVSQSRQKALLVDISKYIQNSQKKRIGLQKNPDFSDYEPRHPQRIFKESPYPLKFLYGGSPKSESNPRGYRSARLVYLRHWRFYKEKFIVGYDEINPQRGDLEEWFLFENIYKKSSAKNNKMSWFMPETNEDVGRSSHFSGLKLKRTNLSGAMFQKLKMAKYLKKGLQDNDGAMWVGFIGLAAKIARVHQFGLTRYANNGGLTELKGVCQHYPVRKLLGLTRYDEEQILKMVIAEIEN